MQKIFFVSLTVTLLVSYVSAQHFSNNPCPERPIIQNFDLQKYISKQWYEILRFDVPFEKGCSCGRATYSLNNDGTVNVKNCCKRPEGGHCALGSAILTEPDHVPLEGKLNVSFNNQPNTKSNYWILSTDYENYSIVYFCKNISGDKSVELAWLLSTKPQIESSIQPTVDALMTQYFDKNSMYVVNQNVDYCQSE